MSTSNQVSSYEQLNLQRSSHEPTSQLVSTSATLTQIEREKTDSSSATITSKISPRTETAINSTESTAGETNESKQTYTNIHTETKTDTETETDGKISESIISEKRFEKGLNYE